MANTRLRPRSYNKLRFDDAAQTLDELTAELPRADLLRGGKGRVLTFGSCFAERIAAALRHRNMQALCYGFAEQVNTPQTNLAFLDYALHGADSPYAKVIETHRAIFQDPDGFAKLRGAVKTANIAVFTVGVGIQWIDTESAETVIMPDTKNMKRYRTRYPSPAEQAETLRDIIRLMRAENPRIVIFLTLSPVPLEFSLQYQSAVVSDCVSKSILRAAIHEVMSERIANVCYYPSFEFVRWVSGHMAEKFFGADGKVRHVNEPVVQLLVDRFIELYSTPATAA